MRAQIMGILNLTPDSFFAGSRAQSVQQAVDRTGQMLADGADLLDLGAASTRPGAKEISQAEELDRLMPVLEAIVAAFPAASISVDTYRGSVAHAALASGARWINDITGGADPAMYPVVARHKATYVLMHSRGTPATMGTLTEYDDVAADIAAWMLPRIAALHSLGVHNVVVDPGLGFAKTPAQSLELINALPFLRHLSVPLLVGASRKGMVWRTLGRTPDTALAGTCAVHYQALLHGASILRVHDVAAAVDVRAMHRALRIVNNE